jgi:hypothetical protein
VLIAVCYRDWGFLSKPAAGRIHARGGRGAQLSFVGDAYEGAKSVLHKAEDAATSAAHKVGDAAGKLADEVANDVGSLAGQAKDGLKTAFNAVTTAADHELSALGNSFAVQEVKSVASSLGIVNSSITETTKADNLVQAGDNRWTTKDNRFSIQTVDKLEHQADTDALWAKFDADVRARTPKGKDSSASDSDKEACRADKSAKPDPAYLDFTSLLSGLDKTNKKPQPCDAPVDKHGLEYIDAQGNHVHVEVTPGQATYQAFDGDKLVTSAVQTADHATLFHGGQTFNLDIKGQKLEMNSDQVNVLQTKEFAEVKLKTGQTIIRKGDTIELQDESGKVVEQIKANSITFGGVPVFGTQEDMKKATDGRIGKATEAETYVAKDGTARIVAANGDVLDVNRDGRIMIHDKDGHVFVIGTDKKMYVQVDGKFIPITEWRGDGKTHVDGDGNAQSEGFGYFNGVLRFAQASLDVHEQVLRFRDQLNRKVKVQLAHDPDEHPAGGSPAGEPEKPGEPSKPAGGSDKPAGGSTTGTTAEKPHESHAGVTVEVEGVGTLKATAGSDDVTTTLPSGETFHATMGAQPSLSNKYVTVKSDEIDVPDPDDPNRKPTIIKPNGDVFTDGGDGPRLYHDGSMQLDSRTSFSADGVVRSGDWVFSRNPSYYSSYDERLRNLIHSNEPRTMAVLAGAAQSASASAQGAASEVYNKAQGGIVTMADIGKLNSSIADISMLLNQLGGNTCAAAGELQAMLGVLSQTLDFATPKAAAAQVAIDRGERSPFIIKEIEDNTGGRSPDQAAMRILTHSN